jgi:AcrR family transcriptional regulator
MTEAPAGRRERKKAATRQAIADAALRLFSERGYDQVGMREIADAADVSTATLFKHFPGKEALVFDREQHTEAALVAAVREREEGQSVLEALREHVLRTLLPLVRDPRLREFVNLVNSTPALREYSERMWTRHTDTLAAAIADEYGVGHDDLACGTLARYVLEIPNIVRGRKKNVRADVEAIFEILTNGWRPPS